MLPINRKEKSEEGRRTHRPKLCEYNNKEEDNSPKTLNDTNHQASSQKFRQLMLGLILFCFVLFLSYFISFFV